MKIINLRELHEDFMPDFNKRLGVQYKTIIKKNVNDSIFIYCINPSINLLTFIARETFTGSFAITFNVKEADIVVIKSWYEEDGALIDKIKQINNKCIFLPVIKGNAEKTLFPWDLTLEVDKEKNLINDIKVKVDLLYEYKINGN
jgi:hypothetical protein